VFFLLCTHLISPRFPILLDSIHPGIGIEAKKELVDFELDTRTMSSFELANALWDRIEASHTGADIPRPQQPSAQASFATPLPLPPSAHV
jgi:hypothetical protein